MITRLDLGMSTLHPAIGIEAIGAAATGSSGADGSHEAALSPRADFRRDHHHGRDRCG